jgi:tetratricopeptide (TPR) repeat protein
MKTGQIDDAIASFQRAVEIHPSRAVYHLRLGQALDKAGQLDAAIDAMTQAFEAEETALILQQIAMLYLRMGRVSDAHDALNRALLLDPLWAPSHHGLSLILDAEGLPEDALAASKRAVELDPQNEVFRRRYA